MTKTEQRAEAIKYCMALASGETDPITIMATTACELFQRVDGYDWVGFYRVVAPELLKIGPYQGGHGCLVIPFDKGVCGAAAREQKTQLVPDVDVFSGHIACASSTKSEIVVPVFDKAGDLIAVLDVDSDTPDFFDAADQLELEKLCKLMFAIL